MQIEINNKKYEVIKNEKDAVDTDVIKEYLTEYFDDYDYILGDYAYNKLRLKGFCEKNNKLFKPLNDCKKIDNYVKNNCAYGCRHFVLKKIN